MGKMKVLKVLIVVVLGLLVLHICSNFMRLDFRSTVRTEVECYYITDNCKVCEGDVWEYDGGNMDSPYYKPEITEYTILEITGHYYRYEFEGIFGKVDTDDNFDGFFSKDFCNRNSVKRFKLVKRLGLGIDN